MLLWKELIDNGYPLIKRKLVDISGMNPMENSIAYVKRLNNIYTNTINLSPRKEFEDICYKLTPFLSKEFPKIDKKSNKKSLLVECRELKHIEFVIKNTIQKLGDGWGHIIYCSNDNYTQIVNICNSISSDIEIRILDTNISSINDYNNLMLDINFWNDINCEKVLVYQSDTFIFKDFDNKFLKYDWIGANWTKNNADVINKIIGYSNLTGANGGLSLRNVNVIKNILNTKTPKKVTFNNLDIVPEDTFYSYHIKNNNYEFPSMSECQEFSYEGIHSTNSFACHQPWLDNFDTFKSIIGGVNLIGFINGVFGLGKSCRILKTVLDISKIPNNLFDLTNKTIHNKLDYYDIDYNDYYNTNIIFCNPDIKDTLTIKFDGKYNIGVWFWELEKIPNSWKEFAEKLDEIWVNTSFIKDILERELPGKKIKLLKLPFSDITIKDKLECRKNLNLNNEDFIFLFVYDYYSDFYRKNPDGVIKAFKKAFNNENCKLIIKSQNSPENVDIIMKNLIDDRITYINETWDENKMNDLFGSCDAYVSLHRSEGLGLTIFESILREIPVICTNYSGNLDFCVNMDNLLVDYDMIDIDKNSIYHTFMNTIADIKWANPYIDDASNKMLYLYNNYQLCKDDIIKCKNYIQQEYNYEKSSDTLIKYLNEIHKEKVDVIINVYGKPWQTLCSLKSLMKYSGKHIDKIYFIEEKEQPYNDDVKWILKEFDNIIHYTPIDYNFITNKTNCGDLNIADNRYKFRYQYGIENSNKKHVFILHNDILFTGDILGEMLGQIDNNVGIGLIGQCWNCSANQLCDRNNIDNYNPTYKEFVQTYNNFYHGRDFLSLVNKEQPMPLPECRLNEFACLINRKMSLQSDEFFGCFSLDLGDLWFRDMILKGYKFKNYDIDKISIHGYFANSNGYSNQLDNQKYIESELVAKNFCKTEYKIEQPIDNLDFINLEMKKICNTYHVR